MTFVERLADKENTSSLNDVSCVLCVYQRDVEESICFLGKVSQCTNVRKNYGEKTHFPLAPLLDHYMMPF